MLSMLTDLTKSILKTEGKKVPSCTIINVFCRMQKKCKVSFNKHHVLWRQFFICLVTSKVPSCTIFNGFFCMMQSGIEGRPVSHKAKDLPLGQHSIYKLKLSKKSFAMTSDAPNKCKKAYYIKCGSDTQTIQSSNWPKFYRKKPNI